MEIVFSIPIDMYLESLREKGGYKTYLKNSWNSSKFDENYKTTDPRHPTNPTCKKHEENNIKRNRN